MGARLQHLINHVRTHTENETPVGTDSITDQEMVFMFNEALDRLWSKIVSVHPHMFVEELVIQTTGGTEAYDIPERAFTESRVLSVEYSDNGVDYYMLNKASYKNRNSSDTGTPTFYFRKNSKILVNPIPSTNSGSLRISYVRRPNNLDIKRSVIPAAGITIAGGAITALKATTTNFDVATLAANYDHLCIVDFYGNIKVANIPFTAIDTGTGVITIATTTHTLASGETAAVGDTIVGGKWTSTHSELPEVCDRYLSQFVIYKLFKRDSSEDAVGAFQELSLIEEDILESFTDQDDDVKFPPVLSAYEVF